MIVKEEKYLLKDLLSVKYVLLGNMFQQKVEVSVPFVLLVGSVKTQLQLSVQNANKVCILQTKV